MRESRQHHAVQASDWFLGQRTDVPLFNDTSNPGYPPHRLRVAGSIMTATANSFLVIAAGIEGSDVKAVFVSLALQDLQ